MTTDAVKTPPVRLADGEYHGIMFRDQLQLYRDGARIKGRPYDDAVIRYLGALSRSPKDADSAS